jgi:hypothetical protein
MSADFAQEMREMPARLALFASAAMLTHDSIHVSDGKIRVDQILKWIRNFQKCERMVAGW